MNITLTSRSLLVATSAAFLLGGCANMSETQKGTATGAGIGAVGGAIISKATGGKAGTGAVIGGAVGAVAGNIWSKRMEEKRKAMEEATKGTGVDVSRTADNQLKVNVPSDISFASGSAALKPELTSVLSQFAHGLDSTVIVQVVGHTDSQGGESYNQTLSLNRADSVRSYLVKQGVPSSRVLTDGRGETQPIADNTTAEGRAKNRRVEIFLREPEKAGS
ncbi:MAG: OmpA family protein [Leptothrix sp. (in: b-proteobacteria)]